MTANSNQLPTVFGIESENTTDSMYRFASLQRQSERAANLERQAGFRVPLVSRWFVSAFFRFRKPTFVSDRFGCRTSISRDISMTGSYQEPHLALPRRKRPVAPAKSASQSGHLQDADRHIAPPCPCSRSGQPGHWAFDIGEHPGVVWP